MRRFLIWSGLAILLGVAAAGVGYWAYWNFFSRFQPVTVTRNVAEIQQLLDEASWVSEGAGGAPLYLIGYRDDALIRYQREEADKLRAAGVEARVVVFARPDAEGATQSTAAERATVAELWLSRDWSLFQRWTTTPARSWSAPGLPPADGDLARTAVVEAGRDFSRRLTDLLEEADVSVAYPLVLWRDRERFLKACACADSRAWAFIRDDLGAPERVEGSTAAAGPTPPSAAAGAPTEGEAGVLPYPNLPSIPAAPQPGAAPAERPARPRPEPASPGARPAPQPSQQDDATFF